MKKIKKLSICLSSLPLLFNTSCISGLNPNGAENVSNQSIVFDSKGRKIEGILDFYIAKQTNIDSLLKQEENVTDRHTANYADAMVVAGTRLNVEWGNVISSKIQVDGEEKEMTSYQVDVTNYVKKETSKSGTFYFESTRDSRSLIDDYKLSLIFRPFNKIGESIQYSLANSSVKFFSYCKENSNKEVKPTWYGVSENLKTDETINNNYYYNVSLFDYTDKNFEFGYTDLLTAFIGICVPKGEELKIVIDKLS